MGADYPDKKEELPIWYRVLNRISFGGLHKLILASPEVYGIKERLKQAIGLEEDNQSLDKVLEVGGQRIEGLKEEEGTLEDIRQRMQKKGIEPEKLTTENLAGTIEQILKERAEALASVEKLEKDPRKLLGEHMWDESQSGVLFVNPDHVVIEANENALKYLGLELPEVVGNRLNEVIQSNGYFGRYIALFIEYAKEFGEQGQAFSPNTFKVGDAAFSVRGYSTVSQERKHIGGFVVLTPHVSIGLIEQLSKAFKTTIYARGALTYDQVLNECAFPIMTSKKSVYIDMSELELIETGSLDTLAKGHLVLAKQGAKCVFKNVPKDIVCYLRDEHGIDTDSIRGIRYSKKATIATEREIKEYLAMQNAKKEGVEDIRLRGDILPNEA
ncbi:PAS domain-containing protein [Candidatus Woesearchaeota archaeon]|nr:PAS domain-containing protein [Candidatus Woesearchaeota archaeon]